MWDLVRNLEDRFSQNEAQVRVVVEGEKSRPVTVGSGVPQGTVLRALPFLCYMNDLPECAESQIRLFADDCLLYRPIKSPRNHQILQKNLISLQKWASDLGMKFNAKTCYLLRTKFPPDQITSKPLTPYPQTSPKQPDRL